MDTAKIFWSGRSQAVRLPKEYRFEGELVRIRRLGAGVLLEPVAQDWSWLSALPGRLDDDDAAAAAREQPVPQQRDELDWESRSVRTTC